MVIQCDARLVIFWVPIPNRFNGEVGIGSSTDQVDVSRVI